MEIEIFKKYIIRLCNIAAKYNCTRATKSKNCFQEVKKSMIPFVIGHFWSKWNELIKKSSGGFFYIIGNEILHILDLRFEFLVTLRPSIRHSHTNRRNSTAELSVSR